MTSLVHSGFALPTILTARWHRTRRVSGRRVPPPREREERDMRRFEVAEGSMAPALLPGDWLVTTGLRRPRRGDVVVFPHPHHRSFWLVKRVVGLPGERVEVAEGLVRVDGTAVPHDVATPGGGAWTLDGDQVFVLSDARTATLADSRTFGPVPVAGCERVRLRYWPAGRIRLW
jgi:signal peptidase I